MVFVLFSCAWAADGRVSGRLTDPQGQAVAGATLQLTATSGAKTAEASTDLGGRFTFPSVPSGNYEVTASAPGFDPAKRALHLGHNQALFVDLRFARLAARTEMVTVTADVKDVDVQSPDPAVKVFASEDLMDANPGRPGAPISIPGYPVETASSGIKAPQYFAPGVAGDHGEPIAQFIQVGSYLVPNNLSADR
jgi:hypothetical protein